MFSDRKGHSKREKAALKALNRHIQTQTDTNWYTVDRWDRVSY